jgi:hypothetical protein
MKSISKYLNKESHQMEVLATIHFNRLKKVGVHFLLPT